MEMVFNLLKRDKELKVINNLINNLMQIINSNAH